MYKLTKFALKRPVTLLLALLTVLFFGIKGLLAAPMEMTPDMEFPMMILSTVYSGANPADVNELVTKKIEDSVSTLSGLSKVTSYSMENMSLVLLRYQYGTNMDTAYLELRKKMDAVKSNLPEDAKDPTVLEMDMNAQPSMQLTISGGTDTNLRSYVNEKIVPELEKLPSVGQVSVAGGRDHYIRVEVNDEKLKNYKLSMSSLAQIVGAADFTMPAGSTSIGDQKISVSTGESYKDIEAIKSIAVPLSTGEVVRLADVADVYDKLEDLSSIARYDGQDVVTISVTKQQSASAVKVSNEIKGELAKLEKENPTLKDHVSYDARDSIINALTGVFETLAIAIVLAMAILFLFFGNVKASLIVGTSIPISVLVALVCMSAMGFSTNLISVGSLVLGVGMVVDNSIVVLDSCFRAKEGRTFYDGALEGARVVLSAIAGSTITTCVVFLPLALLAGLSGQLFKQFGFMIVFCMLASLFSACTIVPMLFYFLHPVERESPISHFMHAFQEGYKKLVAKLLRHGKSITIAVLVMLAGSLFLATKLGFELMPTIDGGIVNVTVTMKPGLKAEAANGILANAEKIVAEDPDVKDYLLTYGNSGVSFMSTGSTGGSITAYLKSEKEGRKTKTADKVVAWKKAFASVQDCTISVESSSSTGMSMMNTNQVEVDLQGTDLETVKKTADSIVEELHTKPYVTKVHSSAENAAPYIKVNVDPVKAQAEGLTPSGVAGSLYLAMSGKEAYTYTVSGRDYTVRIEYPDGTFDSLDKVKSWLVTTATGAQVPLSDLASVSYEDSPTTIEKVSKKYQVAITAEPVEQYKKTAAADMKKMVKEFGLPNGVEIAESALDTTMSEELGALGGALGTAIFLIFIVMAMQFESPKFSIMVMTTIPFSLIGAFSFLYFAGCKINMVSMIGFLMMVGTVVNNGILYVDTVNQLRVDTELDQALAVAGAIRLRPILMTTLTTIIAMIPLCMAIGDSGQLLQGLALVNVGGLTASTILALLVLPIFYKGMDNWGKKAVGEDGMPANVD